MTDSFSVCSLYMCVCARARVCVVDHGSDNWGWVQIIGTTFPYVTFSALNLRPLNSEVYLGLFARI